MFGIYFFGLEMFRAPTALLCYDLGLSNIPFQQWAKIWLVKVKRKLS